MFALVLTIFAALGFLLGRAIRRRLEPTEHEMVTRVMEPEELRPLLDTIRPPSRRRSDGQP